MRNKNIKSGLILAGGGAKGAYAFGVMKAIQISGQFDFDLVAGTSVGGLNALLWSTKRLDLGEELYRNLSFSNSYPRSSAFKWIPNGLYFFWGAFWFLISIVVNVAFGKLTPSSAINTCVATLITLVLTSYLWAGVYVLHFQNPNAWPLYIAKGLLGFWTVRLIYRISRGHRHGSDWYHLEELFFYGLFGAVWFSFIILSFALAFFVYARCDWIPPTLLGITAAAIVVPCIVMLCFKIAGLTTQVVRGETVLSQTALRQKVRDIVYSNPLEIPTYVCIARHVIEEPNDLEYQRRQSDYVDQLIKSANSNWKQFPSPLPVDVFQTKGYWIGELICLNRISDDRKVDAICASAALPFGIVPPVLVSGGLAVDGGLVNNVPVDAAVRSNCSKCVIILMESFKTEESALASVGIVRTADGRFQFRGKHIFSSVHVFYPSKSLGNFLTGTLNFRARYCNGILDDGFNHATKKLAELYPKPTKSK